MTDFFALLGLPRRPWLDEEAVREAFHRLSRSRHPDQSPPAPESAPGVGADPGGFADLNAAQRALRDPRRRVQHLLELEFPDALTAGPAPLPAVVGDLLFPVQDLLRRLDAFLVRRDAAAGALARALLAPAGQSLRREAAARADDLAARAVRLAEQLRAADARWELTGAGRAAPGAAALVPGLVAWSQQSGYLARWNEQLRERLFRFDAGADPRG